jgi:transposase-like protein
MALFTAEERADIVREHIEENKQKHIKKEEELCSEAVKQWVKDKQENPLGGKELTITTQSK